MTSSSHDLATAQPLDDQRVQRLRRYTFGVTAALIVLCNAVLLLGIWGSGVNLDSVFRTPDVFNPARDICLRFSWHKVAGVERPVRLCYEWINLSDPSGETHKFQKEMEVVEGADGKLYYDRGASFDYRVVALGAFVAGIVAVGIIVKRRLIAWYRGRLGLPASRA